MRHSSPRRLLLTSGLVGLPLLVAAPATAACVASTPTLSECDGETAGPVTIPGPGTLWVKSGARITSAPGGLAVTVPAGALSIVNDGIIDGDILFGDGDDRLVIGSASVITGRVDFGDGDDAVQLTVDGDLALDAGAYDHLERIEAVMTAPGQSLRLEAGEIPVTANIVVSRSGGSDPRGHVINSAIIETTGGGGFGYGVRTDGLERVTNSGTIRFGGAGVALFASATTEIINSGSISADGASDIAIATSGVTRIENSGTITAGGAALYELSPGPMTFINRGRVALSRDASDIGGAAFVTGAQFHLVNERDGTIDGHGAAAIIGNGGSAGTSAIRIDNAGVITGAVILSAGDDRFTSLGGRLEGDLWFGGGDDDLILDGDSRIDGAIDGGDGHDRITVTGDGTITLDGDRITAVEDVIQGGPGILHLSGHLAVARLDSAGSLVLDGDVSGAVTIAAGGRLMGRGRINGTVRNSGTLAPGNSPGRIAISGDYVQDTGAALVIEIAAPAGPAPVAGVDYDQLAITGTATLGGTLALVIAPGAIAPDFSYDLLTADGGISGDFAAITGLVPSRFYTLVPSRVEENGSSIYRLTAIRRAYAGAAETANETATANAFTAALQDPGASPDMMGVLGRLDRADAAGARALFHQANGEIYAALVTAAQAFGDAFGRSLQQAARSARTGVWVSAAQHWGHGKSDGNAAAVDLGLESVTAGVDMAVTEGARVGIALTSGSASPRLGTGVARADSDGWSAAVYGSLRRGAFGLSALYARSRFRHAVTRDLPMIGRTARSDSRGGGDLVAVEAFHRIAAGRILATPLAGVVYNRARFDGVSESGAGALDLVVAGGWARSLRAYAGGEGRITFSFDGFTAAPYGRLVYGHDFAANARRVTAAFSGGGSAFTVNGRTPSRDGLMMEAGVALTLSDVAMIEIGYGGDWRGDSHQDGISASLRLPF